MKIILTSSEIIAKFGLPDTVELVIDQVQDGGDGWISNVGNNLPRRPDSLSINTRIEVKYRSGAIEQGCVHRWRENWKETGGTRYDIIAYRILKD